MTGSIRCLKCGRSLEPTKKYPTPCKCRGVTRKEIRVSLGTDPVTNRPRQLSRTFELGRTDAKLKLAELVASVGRSPVGSEIDFAELLRLWLQHISGRGLAAGTLDEYRRNARIIGIALGHVPAKKLTAYDIEDFYRRLAAAGRKPNTIDRYHSVIRSAFGFGVSRGWVTSNPSLEAARPSVRRSEITVPTPAEVMAILTAAEERSPEHAVYLRTAAATWARRGELVALRRSAVNLEIGEVLIAFSMSRHQGRKDTKTHGRRRLSIDADTTAALAHHLDLMAKRAEAAGVSLARDPFVFSDEFDCSQPWHVVRPTRFFAAYAKTAGIQGVRLHDLRHFGATQALAHGVPITTVAYRLGHSLVSTTLDTYSHWIPSTDRIASDLMGRILTYEPELVDEPDDDIDDDEGGAR